MRKTVTTLLILALSLMLTTACSRTGDKNDNVSPASDKTAGIDGSHAAGNSANGAVKLEAGSFSKVRIKGLYDNSLIEHEDKALIEELCAMLSGQSYSKSNTEWEGDYQVELLGSDGKPAVVVTVQGIVVVFDRDIDIGGKLVKKGAYQAGQWISDYVRKFSVGVTVDPVYIQYPATISIPDNFFYQELFDRGSSKINSYEVIEQTYDFLNNSFANKEFKILKSQRLYSSEAIEAEEARVRRDSRCIQIHFNTSETYLEIQSESDSKQCAKALVITLAANPDKPGTYKLITDSMIFDIEAGEDFNTRFDAIFTNNRNAAEDLTPDAIQRLFEENKPYYLEYICKNLEIESWSGREPDRLEISKLKLGKADVPYTVVEIYNPFDVRLLAFEGGNGRPWRFIDFIGFGGRTAGTEYRLETYGDHVWVVGNSCRGYGTGEVRYYEDWYELTETGKKLVLSFPYDEYFEHHIGGYSIKADSIKAKTAGEMKVVAGYTITKRYPLALDIADEYGIVSVSAKKSVEYRWNEAAGRFESEYAVNEYGMTEVLPESPEITRKCDEILEKYYNELVKSLDGVEAEENKFVKDARIVGMRRFLEDCSNGDKKAALMELLD